MARVWALVPASSPTNEGGNSGADLTIEGVVSDTRSSYSLSPKMDIDSDNSVTEFERNIRKLLPCLHEESNTSKIGQSTGTKKSERQKKPSSRFNEEVGYLVEIPKSAKKKRAGGDGDKGTNAKPLLIADWSDVQIVKYCDACGISFSNSVNDYINHIRNLEKSHSCCPLEFGATSLEGQGF